MTLHSNVKSKIIRFLICIHTLWNAEKNGSFLVVNNKTTISRDVTSCILWVKFTWKSKLWIKCVEHRLYMVNEKNVACKKMYAIIKGKNRLYEKKKRLIVHANMNLWKRCVNETVLHTKFLYLIYKKKHALSTLLSATPG